MTLVAWSKPRGHWYHFLMYGQSLSVGYYGHQAISQWQPFHNRTFRNGPAGVLQDDMWGSYWLLEDGVETPVAYTCNKISEHSGWQMFGSTAGELNQVINGLEKGSLRYDLLFDHVMNARVLASQRNASYSIAAIGFLQGYTDQFLGVKTQQEYYDDLIQLQSAVSADLGNTIQQWLQIPFFIHQISTHVGIGKRNVTLAQLEAHETSEHIHISHPIYPIETYDGIHHTNYGYAVAGHYLARAFNAVVVDKGIWTGLTPTNVSANGQTIEVTLVVPEPPIVFDPEDRFPPIQDEGFAVEDDGGQLTINSVAITGDDTLEITINRNLTSNPHLRYALDYQHTDLSEKKIKDGAMGKLTDSDETWYKWNGYEHRLNNWCLHFDKVITT